MERENGTATWFRAEGHKELPMKNTKIRNTAGNRNRNDRAV